jgi:hypothetical protein
MQKMISRRTSIYAGISIFLVGVLYDLGLQALMRPYARDGIYFQTWSSEDMMQTVSIRDLRLQPLPTLLNIHIQPPAFDLIRAALAWLSPARDMSVLLKQVDYALYVLWAALFGLLGVLIFLWLSKQTGTLIAFAAALVFLLHPASIFYATYLDTTLLSALLILLSYYLLWKIKNGYHASILWLAVVTLMLFFTRSIFQLPYMLLVGACLFLLRVPRKGIIAFLVITGVLSGLYTAKQWLQFRTISTSSMAGVNLANSVGVGMGTANYAAYVSDPRNIKITDARLPDVLLATTKLSGQPNFNNINYLALNQSLVRRFEKQLLSAPRADLARSYAQNLDIYFKPSSSYSSGHAIVDRLPWTNAYNSVFSAPVLPILLIMGLAAWVTRIVRQPGYSRGVALLLPGLFVFSASVLLDKGENMRFKFFLEPVMYVFMISQFYFLAHAGWIRLTSVRGPL